MENSIFSDDDWAVLLPENIVQIGSKAISIKPLTISNFSTISAKATHVFKQLKAKGYFTDPETYGNDIAKAAPFILSEIPEVISEITSIPEGDLKRLPIGKVVEIITSIIEINIRDHETLEKNLGSLMSLMGLFIRSVNPTQA